MSGPGDSLRALEPAISQSVEHLLQLAIPKVDVYVVDARLPADRRHVGLLSVYKIRIPPWRVFGLTFSTWQSKFQKYQAIIEKATSLRKDATEKNAIATQKRKLANERKGIADQAKTPQDKKIANSDYQKSNLEATKAEKNSQKADADAKQAEAHAQKTQPFYDTLQEVASQVAYQPHRDNILAELKDKKALPGLADIYCRGQSAPGDSDTPLGSYKIPTWVAPDSPAVLQDSKVNKDPTPFGSYWTLILSQPGHEFLYLSLPPRLRVHSGRTLHPKEGLPPYKLYNSGTAANYHMVPNPAIAQGLDILCWTEGCIRVTRDAMEKIVAAFEPVKNEAPPRKALALLIAREFEKPCAASDYCSHTIK